MDCNRLTATLDALVDEELDAAERSAALQHVETCQACAARLARARSVRRALATLPIEPPSARFFERAVARAAQLGARRRPPRLVAFGFLSAFAASILTVILTGLWVRAPDSATQREALEVSIARDESRVVKLVFAATDELSDVGLTIELPPGVEVAGHEGRRRIAWRTRLHSGNNILPLELVAVGAGGGELVARLESGGKDKVFVIEVTVG